MHAIATANYIGILAWAIAMGVVLRHGVPATREVLSDAAKGVEFVVRIVVRFAPIGIFGLVASTLATTGLEAMTGYFKLLAVLIGTMAAVALILNPFLVWLTIRANPFPYTWMTLRESGVAAFFTRSSAANIPVNLEICRRLDLPESTYSVSIPVGATVNMAGARSRSPCSPSRPRSRWASPSTSRPRSSSPSSPRSARPAPRRSRRRRSC